jgi:hypothetical protein
MKLFSCSRCGQVVFFESVRCTGCDASLAYLPDRRVISTVEPAGDGFVARVAKREASAANVATAPDGELYRFCQNSLDHGVCNWAVPATDENPYCRGCRLNDIIPNLAHPGALVAWGRIEHAKKRLLYTLFELELPVVSHEESQGGLVFSFKQAEAGSPVFTGHDEGRITLNIAEADNPGRERLREHLGETYRTLLGHFRHEIGHYYWNTVIRGTDRLAPFHDLFGDPDKNYQAELERHYQEGPPTNWQESFVSAYATMHPWEDWAETWAHYLHIVDTLGTARSYGMALRPEATGLSRPPRNLRVNSRSVDFDDFEDLLKAWVPLTVALNSLNRGMGLSDLYPFVLSPRAIEKLRFVHDVIERADASSDVAPQP